MCWLYLSILVTGRQPWSFSVCPLSFSHWRSFLFVLSVYIFFLFSHVCPTSRRPCLDLPSFLKFPSLSGLGACSGLFISSSSSLSVWAVVLQMLRIRVFSLLVEAGRKSEGVFKEIQTRRGLDNLMATFFNTHGDILLKITLVALVEQVCTYTLLHLGESVCSLGTGRDDVLLSSLSRNQLDLSLRLAASSGQ